MCWTRWVLKLWIHGTCGSKGLQYSIGRECCTTTNTVITVIYSKLLFVFVCKIRFPDNTWKSVPKQRRSKPESSLIKNGKLSRKNAEDLSIIQWWYPKIIGLRYHAIMCQNTCLHPTLCPSVTPRIVVGKWMIPKDESSFLCKQERHHLLSSFPSWREWYLTCQWSLSSGRFAKTAKSKKQLAEEVGFEVDNMKVQEAAWSQR